MRLGDFCKFCMFLELFFCLAKKNFGLKIKEKSARFMEGIMEQDLYHMHPSSLI